MERCVGHVLDYMLTSGGESESFRWEYYDSYRKVVESMKIRTDFINK